MVETVQTQKDQSFKSTDNLKFKQISSFKEESVWAISREDYLYFKDGSNWSKIEHEKMFDCSVGADDCVVALSEAEAYPYIWDPVKKIFLQMPNPIRLKQISVGSKNCIMGVKPDGTCWKFDKESEQWKQLQGKDLLYVSCSDDSSWAVDKSGRTLEWQGSSWIERGHRANSLPKFIDISVAKNGVVYAIDENGRVCHWDKDKKNWEESQKIIRKGITNITALENDKWMGIDEDGKIQHL